VGNDTGRSGNVGPATTSFRRKRARQRRQCAHTRSAPTERWKALAEGGRVLHGAACRREEVDVIDRRGLGASLGVKEASWQAARRRQARPYEGRRELAIKFLGFISSGLLTAATDVGREDGSAQPAQ
jgi:hypothetical protein